MAVANQVSDQLTLLDAGKKQAVATEGRSYRRYFSITTALGDAASVVRLCKLYAGERLLGGKIAGVIAGGAGATLALGTGAVGGFVVDAGGAASLMAATAIDAALNANFGNTPALRFGELQTVDSEIMGTIAGGAFLAGKVIAGEVIVQRP
jgi:hypothetical protein